MAFGPSSGAGGLYDLYKTSNKKNKTIQPGSPTMTVQPKPATVNRTAQQGVTLYGGSEIVDNTPSLPSNDQNTSTPAGDNRIIYDPYGSFKKDDSKDRYKAPDISDKPIYAVDGAGVGKMDVKYISKEDLEKLGLDESYIGLPYSIGYVDTNGAWVEVKNALEYAKQLHDLKTLESPEITQLSQTPEYDALSAIIAGMENGTFAEQDYQRGLSYFENLLGFDPGGYTQSMEGLRQGLDQGISGQQGLSEEERDIYNRQTQVQLQQIRDDSSQLLESLGSSGRSVQGYSSMVEISRGMADFQSQRQLELFTQDLMVKQAEYDALEKRYNTMYQMGQVTIGEYVNTLSQNRVQALQGYAQQLTTMAQENQTNIAAYEAHAQVMYQTIMAQLGVDESLLTQAQDFFEMYMAPEYARLEKEALQAQLDESNEIDWAGGAAQVGSFAAIGAGVGSVIPGVGTAIGGAIGAGVGLIAAFLDFLF